MSSEPLPRTELAPDQWIWSKGDDPAFHSRAYHPGLVKHHSLLLNEGKAGRIFVPLCGKTLDMIFLADQGHEVVGLEFSKIGILDFFEENKLTYDEESVPNGPFVKYSVKEKNITIYQGDLFNVSKNICGEFDATWDRGSFVAINLPTREKYAQLMSSLVKSAGKILMEIFIYDPSKYGRPPHIVTEEHLNDNFKDFNVKILEFKAIKASFYEGDDLKTGHALLTRKLKVGL